MKTKGLLFGACLCLLSACNMPDKETGIDVYETLDYCNDQVQRTLTELKGADGTIDYTMMPRNIITKDSLTRLKIYRGSEHKHAAQKPELWAL